MVARAAVRAEVHRRAHCHGAARAVLRAGEGAGTGAALLQQITAAASTAGCIGRVKADLADSLAAEFKEASESQFVMVLVKGIVISLLMIMIPPFVQELVDAIIPRFTPLFGPNFIATAEPLLVMALNPLVYGPTGQHLIELCTSTLNARVGAMLVRSLAFHVPRVLAAELPPRLTTYMLETWAPSMGKALLYNVLHALTHSLADSLSHHLSQAVTQGVTHSISHALIHYYYCTFCYYYGDYCQYCFYYRDFSWLHRMTWTGSALTPNLISDSPQVVCDCHLMTR